jgi:methylated-DNA-protein-cysteine methyltransferase related protein
MSKFKDDVVAFVKRIPYGKLVNYGYVSQNVGGTAQTVGWIMSGLSVEECEVIPWHRVVAKTGDISTLKLGVKGLLQKTMLEEEGFEIVDDKVDLNSNFWYGD